MADLERIRLVILGGAGVGKSCIVKRFLFKTYSDKYRATVEDLYNREYDLGSTSNIKVRHFLFLFYFPKRHVQVHYCTILYIPSVKGREKSVSL